MPDEREDREFAAAFSFRVDDLVNAVVRKVREKHAELGDYLVAFNPQGAPIYRIYADYSEAASKKLIFQTRPGSTDVNISSFDIEVKMYILTAEQAEEGIDPKSSNFLTLKLSSGANGIQYKIGCFDDIENKFPIINKEKVGLPPGQDGRDRNAPNETLISLGAFFYSDLNGGEVYCEITSGDYTVTEWFKKEYPQYRENLRRMLFPEITLIADVKNEIMDTIKLTGDVDSFVTSSLSSLQGIDVLVIGSKKAVLMPPACPTRYMEAFVEKSDLDASQASVRYSDGGINFDNVKISKRSRLSSDYKLADSFPNESHPLFSTWLSKPLIEKTFSKRFGDRLSPMLGARYKDRIGPVKWWMTGAWVLEGIDGQLTVSLDRNNLARLQIGFDGATSFNAISYVDFNCFTYELGSFDGWHEKFDFDLISQIYLSKEGKVAFVGGFDNIQFDNWNSFIRTFLDRFIETNWKGIVASIVVKYVIGEFIRRLVEDEITDAMGYLSMDLFDLKRIPVVGNLFSIAMENHGLDLTNFIASIPIQTESGLDILIGARDSFMIGQ